MDLLGIHDEAPGSSLPECLKVEAHEVGRMAERDVLSLHLPRCKQFETLYSYVVVDEPAVHLMPIHFLPRASAAVPDADSLLALGVAAKLGYVRSRWLDEIVDTGCAGSLLAVHRLDNALTDLINARYAQVLPGNISGRFFTILSDLNARHGASLAIDGSHRLRAMNALEEEDFVHHARCRHGSYRASVDAVLLLSGVSDATLHRARQAWHSWALGVQFYDDALDIEEDFEEQNLSWALHRALDLKEKNGTVDRRLDSDSFYQSEIVRVVVVKALARAEAFFAEAAHLADGLFPTWAALQRACVAQAGSLRKDLQRLTANGE